MNNHNKKKIKNIFLLIIKDGANIFTPFLFVYIGIYIMSLFFPLWKFFWTELMLHISFGSFGLMFLFEKRNIVQSILFYSKNDLPSLFKFLLLNLFAWCKKI